MANHVSVRRDRFRELIRRFPKSQRLLARAFWVEALMRANWADGENANGRDALNLRRGQFPMGRAEMSEELGCSERELRTIRDRFETIEEMAIRTTKRGTIVTIVNYDVYVNDGYKNDHQSDHETTIRRPSDDHSKEVQETEASEDMENNNNTGIPEVPPNGAVPPVVDGVVVVPELIKDVFGIDKLPLEEIAEISAISQNNLRAVKLFTQSKTRKHPARFLLWGVQNLDKVPQKFFSAAYSNGHPSSPLPTQPPAPLPESPTPISMEEFARLREASEYRDLWSQLSASIKSDIEPKSFQKWFDPVFILEICDRDVTIATPTEDDRKWLQENYDFLIKLHAKILGHEWSQIRYVVPEVCPQ